MKRQKGFSLIELLIVVAIILIIAAIAIPNLMRARIAANESSAAANSRTIATAEVSYWQTYTDANNVHFYSADLASLAGAAANCAPGGQPDKDNACLIDKELGAAVDANHAKSGYIFTYAPVGTGNDAFTLNADASSTNVGVRHFYTDQTNVIRVNGSAAAGATDPAL